MIFITLHDIIGLGIAGLLLLAIAGLFAAHYAQRVIRRVKGWWAR